MAEPLFPEARLPELLVESWSNAARTVRVRGWVRDALIALDHTTNADRSRATSTVRISRVPDSLAVTLSGLDVRRGECFVRVSVRMGGSVVRILGHGYIYDGEGLQYPPGRYEGFCEGLGLLRSITGTNPAAGAEVSETTPTNARWRLIGLRVQLVTSADVADRVCSFLLDDGTNVFYALNDGLTQTASQSIYHAATPIPLRGDMGRGAITPLTTVPVMLSGGWRVRTVTSGIQAADDYGAPQLLVEEWIEE